MTDTFLILDDYYVDGIHLKVVRDDIYPFVGGGSKARKAVAYEKFLRENGYNAVVTCGGIQSNHNRAMALLCAKMDGNAICVFREKWSVLKRRKEMLY